MISSGILAGAVARGSGGGGAPTSVFTMTQLPYALKNYQRSTNTGGGQGKGQGTIPVTINASTAGTCQARMRSAADGTTILQGPINLTIAGTGSQTLNVTGVDVRLGWFYVDLLDSSGSWKLGTIAVGMAGRTAVAGQSLQELMLHLETSIDTTTISALGITPSPYGTLFAGYSGTPSNFIPTIWEVPSDAGNYSSAGAAQYLNNKIAKEGCNWSVIGFCYGNTAIGSWLPGQPYNILLLSILATADNGFEEFIWNQGHSDSVALSPYVYYRDSMVSLFASISAVATRSFAKYATSIPNINTAAWGPMGAIVTIRKAMFDSMPLIGATYFGYSDIQLTTDGTHELQTGAVTEAWHYSRDAGGVPKALSASRSGVNVTLPITPGLGTSMVGFGSPAPRFLVTASQDPSLTPLAFDGVTPITINPTSIVLKLASDPGVSVDVWPMGVVAINNGFTNAVYDNYDPEGFGRGRQLFMNPTPVTAPIHAALTPTGVSYAAGKFSQGRSAGYFISTTSIMGSPYSGYTFDQWIDVPSLVADCGIFISWTTGMWVRVNSGKLQLEGTDLGTFSATGLHHVRLCFDPTGQHFWAYIDGVQTFVGTASRSYTNGQLCIGTFSGSPGSLNYTSVIDEVAVFFAPITPVTTTSFAVPTAPWVGNEANLMYLYHLDNNGNDSCTN